MRVLRVFPRRTALTPDDPMVAIGPPGLFRPLADEVHISVTFTWDRDAAFALADAWRQYYPVVRIGGPAVLRAKSDDGVFVQGRYIKDDVTFTSRGCNGHCPWCLVPEREGPLQLIEPFYPGPIIQDNNLLQTSRPHLNKVFLMLRALPSSHPVVFAGGLEANRLDDWVAEELRSIRIKRLFLAADTDSALPALKRAVDRLSWLPQDRYGIREKIRVYCLVGFHESLEAGVARLEKIWELGVLPFPQLYQPPDRWIQYPIQWRRVAKEWIRPAIAKAVHRDRRVE